MNTEKARTKKSKFAIFSVITHLFWLFRKPCIYCGSRDIEIRGYVYDGANNYEYTLKKCNNCKSLLR